VNPFFKRFAKAVVVMNRVGAADDDDDDDRGQIIRVANAVLHCTDVDNVNWFDVIKHPKKTSASLVVADVVVGKGDAIRTVHVKTRITSIDDEARRVRQMRLRRSAEEGEIFEVRIVVVDVEQ